MPFFGIDLNTQKSLDDFDILNKCNDLFRFINKTILFLLVKKIRLLNTSYLLILRHFVTN